MPTLANHGHRHGLARAAHLARGAYNLYTNYGDSIQKAFSQHNGKTRGMGKRQRKETDLTEEDGVINNTNNAQLVWRGKKESRKHKRKRLHAISLVRRAAFAEAPSNVFIRPCTRTTITNLVGAQGMDLHHPLYSIMGTSAGQWDDVFDMAGILTSSYLNVPNITGVQSTNYKKKIHFKSASQRIEIVNTGTNSAYVDVYEYLSRIFKRNWTGHWLLNSSTMTRA